MKTCQPTPLTLAGGFGNFRFMPRKLRVENEEAIYHVTFGRVSSGRYKPRVVDAIGRGGHLEDARTHRLETTAWP